MASRTLQVTLGAGATQVSATAQPCRQVIIQNNAAHACRYGDVDVSATRGIYLAPGTGGGAANIGSAFGALIAIDLSELYLYGTQNDVIDIWYAF
jgi:hypothetical protein